jgi:hypothetical protein
MGACKINYRFSVERRVDILTTRHTVDTFLVQ